MQGKADGPIFLKSRLFETSTERSTTTTSTSRSSVPSYPRSELFTKDSKLARPPTRPLYGQSPQTTDPPPPHTPRFAKWITVIGVIPGRVREIVEHFSRFGTILRVDDTPGNWVYIEYASEAMAEQAAESGSAEPTLIGGSMLVCATLGRMRSGYVPEPEAPPDRAEFDLGIGELPARNRVSGVGGMIFDAIFG
jgi:hypothetical protein